MKNKKQNRYLNILFVFVGIAILLLIWEITSKLYNNNNIYPDVLVTLKSAFGLLSNGSTYIALLTSLGICLLTMVIAFIFALILGTLSGLFNSIDKILSPFIAIMKVVPTAVIAILLIIFVKSFYSTIIVIFLVVFPILYESIVNGIHNVDKYIIMSLRIEGLYKWNSIFKVLIPQIMPYIYLGIVSSFGLSMKVEIMSEIIVGSVAVSGLGHLIYLSYAVNSDYIELFGLVLITLISFGIVDLILNFGRKTLKNKNIL
ncbi:MAG: ABC transporter permease subunit [Bacilli bacterium]|jgi:NitT/TauT family transport system permease protein